MKDIKISGIVEGMITSDPSGNTPVLKVDGENYTGDQWIKTSWGVMRASDIITMWMEGNKTQLTKEQQEGVALFIKSVK